MVAVSLKKIFFKQKTAYEITTRLVGSEMCIRDSYGNGRARTADSGAGNRILWGEDVASPVSYTHLTLPTILLV